MVTCPECKGTGKRLLTNTFFVLPTTCQLCQGTGKVRQRQDRCKVFKKQVTAIMSKGFASGG